MVKLFVYGTLILPEIMRAVSGRIFLAKTCCLENYVRYLVKGEIYPGIIWCPGSKVDGVIYFDLNRQHLKILDRFEGEMYQREHLVVKTDDGETHHAFAYVVKPLYQHLLSNQPWNLEEFKEKYVNQFVQGYSGFRWIRSL